ncbi:MAG TPA: hypothetical protein VJR92_04305 [Gemmatimonadaceae bacterium]|nr:hypothetical protein [Gemmatimonadaceae bacterium]
MTTKKSDFGAAALGFFGGAVVLAAILYGVSVWTTSRFAAHEGTGATPAAEHKSP